MRWTGVRGVATAGLMAATSVVGVGAGPATAVAGVINVPADASTIQAAIDAATNGDTVVVAPGTYHEHINFKGKAIEVKSSAGPATTVIDGDATDIVVKFWSAEPRASVLRGFTITGGRVPTDSSGGGGGISMTTSSPTIVENIITGNDAPGASDVGGGIGSLIGAPLIRDNKIAGNHAGDFGGGVVALAGEVVGNRIEANSAHNGGGLVVSGASTIVRNNVIADNHAQTQGGGVLVGAPGVLFAENLISGNTAGIGGGGIQLHGGETLLRNTFVANVAPAGSALEGTGAATTVTGNILVGAAGTSVVSCRSDLAIAPLFAFNDVYNGDPSPYAGCGGAGFHGNISADPLFASPTDFHLQAASPAIDAGDPAAAGLPSTDLAGAARITDGNGDGMSIVDIGAYEAPGIETGSRFHPLTPARILDTRLGLGAPVGPASTLPLQVTGQGGVPASGVSAVVLNVTVTSPTADSFLTVWPAGLARPLASNLNYLPGQTVPNLVMVKVGDLGRVNLYNNSGATHVLADVAGWYGDTGSVTGSRYTTLPPARILDTRFANGAPTAKLGAGATLDLQVTGRGGVPASGVAAVVLNVTATSPTAISFLTAWPAGVTRPLASNLNVVPGQTVANLVVVKVGDLGRVRLYNNSGATDVLADVAGWFAADGAAGGSGFTSLVPARILDTRIGVGAPLAVVGPGATVDVAVTGHGGVPATGVSAVVLNVTATQASAVSFLTAWPSGLTRPLASNLNYAGGQTVPNLVVVQVGAGGKISLYNNVGTTHLVADVAGWFSG